MIPLTRDSTSPRHIVTIPQANSPPIHQNPRWTRQITCNTTICQSGEQLRRVRRPRKQYPYDMKNRRRRHLQNILTYYIIIRERNLI